MGVTARRLAARLAESRGADDTRIEVLRGLAVDLRPEGGDDDATASDAVGLLILGPTDDLPWIDGAHYLGRSPRAAALMLPTILRPTLPEDLLFRACRARLEASASDAGAPLVVLPADWPGGPALLGAGAARPLDARKLRELAA